ncbi:MAG TPA: hypothetical protein VGR52_01475 [Stellaceae bacterium]|nr:hypothetical protein [Stellaceae bacterium]
MSGDITLLYDKSVIQALNRREVFCLDCHYRINIVPVFYAEVLADLHEPGNKDRPPEDIVGSIAAKISGFSAMPNVHHLTLCVGDLLGHPVDVQGIPVVGGGQVVRDATGKTGIFFDEPPEMVAMRRWQQGDFLGVERDFAKAWRDGLKRQDLAGIAAALRPAGTIPLRDLAEIRAGADMIAAGRGKRLNTLNLALAMLSIPPQYQDPIIARWKACGGPTLGEFAPYADYVFRVDLFFYLGMAAKLIPATRPSHRIDLAYLYYLPFCRVFTSFDRFHTQIVPHFLNHDRQAFVSGADLKADLAALAQHYDALPAEERAKGAMSYAAYPPRTGDFLTSRLYDRFEPGWRDVAANPIEITPERSKAIMEQLKPMIDAIEAAKTKGDA